MKEIDARGLACPAPVLHTKAAIENEDATAVNVWVDNTASQQNVQRFLESKGFQVTVHREDDGWRVLGLADPSSSAAAAATPEAEPSPVFSHETDQKKIMVLCATDRIGFGDDQLGLKLMVSFIKTLREMGPELWRLVFVNNGVKLTIGGSAVLPDLHQYEKNGLQILVCGTCLDHFNLLEHKQVGHTTNMLDIVTAMQLSDKVITI
jgi:selenium metabolism protein YedF